MSGQVKYRLSKAKFPSPTVLPVIEGNHYDLESIIAQALSDASYDSFRSAGYLYFKFPSSVTAMIRKCEVLSGSRVLSCPVTRKTRRVEVSPHLELSLLVHTDETSDAYEEDMTFQNFVKKSSTRGKEPPQGSLDFYDLEFVVEDESSCYTSYHGYVGANELPSMCHAFKSDGDSLLYQILCRGCIELVSSESPSVTPFAGHGLGDLDKDVCLDRSGLESVVIPVISQGSPGFIHELRR